MYDTEPISTAEIRDALMKFNQRRKLGKGLQVGGFGITLIGTALIVPPVAIAGGVVTLSGYITDMTASKHLNEIY